MASVLIVNGTGAELEDVNAAGADVPAYGYGAGGIGTAATLTAAELDTLMAVEGVIIMSATSTQEERRLASKVLRLGKNPGTAVDD